MLFVYSEQNSIAYSTTYISPMFVSGQYWFLYILSTLSCSAQLDTSNIKRQAHTIEYPIPDEQLSELWCQKMMVENTSPIDKG